MTTKRGIRQNLSPIQHRAPAFLDSSLRWNDGRDQNEFVAIPNLNRPAIIPRSHCVIPAKAGIQWFRQDIPAQRE